MITCFPDPYPDEIFYSICARYSERKRYQSGESVKRDFFDNPAVVLTIALPCHLATLVDNLPRRYGYSVDRFIDEHTLFPLFCPFLPQKQMLQARKDMRGENGSSVYYRIGTPVSGIPVPKAEHLRFCSLCVDEDRTRFGECYWHRIHQAPGVLVCPVHKAVLYKIESDTPITSSRSGFLAAEKIADKPAPTFVDGTDACQSLLLDIALDIAWIMNQHNLSYDPAFFGDRYLMLLYERGLATPHTNRKFNTSLLLQEFKAHYPAHLLQMLSCELVEHEMNNWLCRLLYHKERSIHPVYHLLLIHFLGYSLETFVNLPKPRSPFGDGPWPCLNPVSEHYQQKVVHSCSVSVSRTEEGKRPKGVFSCECGFVYSRLGPDLCEEDSFKAWRILTVGSVWEEALRKLWEDPSIGMRKMAQRLGMDRDVLQCHAARLGLPFPRPGGRRLEPRRKLQVHLKGGPIAAQTREHYRTLWLIAREENPGVGSEVLQAKYPKVHSWLYRNDRLWQKEHMPPLPKQEFIRKPRIDWGERDKQTAEELAVIASQIRNSEGPPERVTQAAIFRCIEKGMSLQYSLGQGKLPLARQVLDRVAESCEEFVIRRIWWMRDIYLREKHVLPKRQVFRHQTGSHHYYRSSTKVKEAYDLAIQSLEEHFSC